MKNFVAVVLAAGEGTRMKSETSKVLHTLCGRPMLDHVLDSCSSLKLAKIIVVAGRNFSALRSHLPKNIIVVEQKKQQGTADAVKPALKHIQEENLVIVYGDTPLLSKGTILALMEKHKQRQSAATLLTFKIDNPQGYGRIIRDSLGKILSITEDKDLKPQQKNIKEVNAGLCCFRSADLKAVIQQIRPDNNKKEYYLTDAVKLLAQAGKRVEAYNSDYTFEAEGINTQIQLAGLEKIMRKKIIEKMMSQGVRFIDPDNTYVEDNVTIGSDSIIYPGTYIEKNCKIGRKCKIGPCAHIRSLTTVGDDVKIGNFAEINRSFIDSGARVGHFCYIGDAHLGKNVNIGAGTVTANYDGKNKNKTVIKDNAFIGSGTVLVAPVTVGKNAVTGAGSVVTRNKNIKDNTVVVGVPARVLKTKRS